MEQKSVRGKHEIKAAVIRGRIHIYIYIYIHRRENSRREKKGEKKRRERESFSSLFHVPSLFSIKKKRISRDPRTNERASWVSSGGESSGNDNRAVKFTVWRELKSGKVGVSLQIRSDGTRGEISSYSSALSILAGIIIVPIDWIGRMHWANSNREGKRKSLG